MSIPLQRWLGIGLTAVAISTIGTSGQTPQPKRDYPVQPVPFTEVHLNDVFWAPRIETNRTVDDPGRVPAVRADGPRRSTSSAPPTALRG